MKYLLLERGGSTITADTKVDLVRGSNMVTFDLKNRRAYIKGIESPLSYLPEYTEGEFLKDACITALAILVRDFGYRLYVETSPIFA